MGRMLRSDRVENGVAFLQQMAAQYCRKPDSITMLQRVDHFGVLTCRLVPLVGIEVRPEAQILDAQVQRRVHLRQQSIARGAIADRLMALFLWKCFFVCLRGFIIGWLLASWVCLFRQCETGRVDQESWIQY